VYKLISFQHLELQKANSRIINKNIMEDQVLKSLIKYQLIKDILSSPVTGNKIGFDQGLNWASCIRTGNQKDCKIHLKMS